MTNPNPHLTIEYLRECFDLNNETGELVWRVRPLWHFADDREWWLFNEHFPGTAARPHLDSKGYLRLKFRVEGRVWRVQFHRLVFALANGRWPAWTVDHWDRDRLNNRPGNLREATQSEQMQNAAFAPNKTGYQGVGKHRRGWRARVKIDGKRYYSGVFKTPERAAEAYRALKAAHHPYQPEIPSSPAPLDKNRHGI